MLTSKFFFPFILLALTIPSAVGQEIDATRYEQLLEKIRDSGDSVSFYIKLAEQNANTLRRSMDLNLARGYHLRRQKQLDSAFYYLNSNIDAYRNGEIPDTTFMWTLRYSFDYLRSVYVVNGEYEKAISVAKEAIEMEETYGFQSVPLAGMYLNIGIDYWRLDDYQSSIEWLKKCLNLSEQFNFEKQFLRANITLGLVYKDLNRLDLAEEYCQFALFSIGGDTLTQARDYMSVCNNLAIVYKRRQEFDLALEYYRKALNIVENDRIESIFKHYTNYYLGSITTNIGSVLLSQAKYEDALIYYQKAIVAKELDGGSSHPRLLSAVKGSGEANALLDREEQAMMQYARAIEICEKNNRATFGVLNLIGDLLVSGDRHALARTLYDSALRENRKVVNSFGTVYTDAEEALISYRGILQVIFSGGRFDRTELEGVYEEIVGVMNDILNDSESLSITGLARETLEWLYLIYDKLETEDAIQRLWEIAELSKSVQLRNQLRSEYSLHYSVPKQILEQERHLSDSINERISNLKPGAFDSTLFTLNRTYDQFIEQLEQDYPEYHQLKRDFSTTSLDEFRVRIPPNELVLNFFEGEHRMFLLKLVNDKVEQVVLDLSHLDSLITAFNAAIFSQNDALIGTVSSALKKSLQLSDSELLAMDRMWVIPDGIIWKMNFAAIMLSDGSYMGNEVPIVFDYYADVTNQSRIKHNNGRVLAFSFNGESLDDEIIPNTTFRDLDVSLPGTSKEVAAISNLWSGDYYFAKNANETVFKEKGEAYSILHFAVHGRQDGIYPENSFIQFASEDSLNDGRLHAYEIYNLNLSADLAVLSACNSGDGKIVTGEGMMSMGRSFAYAGVKSLLASRWEVPDISAPFLMKYFYEGLKEGMKKSEALMHAQNQFLVNDSDNITSAPLYWAGFYVIGDDSPIEQKSRHYHFWIIGGLLLVVVSLLIAKRNPA